MSSDVRLHNPSYPDIKEEFKMGVWWYEEKYYIVALKNYVNPGFSLKGLFSKEARLFEGGGKTLKHVKFRSLGEIDEAKVAGLFKIVKEGS